MNWVERIVKQHEEVESPKEFWRWSALATISAVIKDQVWLNRGGLYKLYPNIYVMLHADSGLKKGPPVAMSKQIVKNVNNTRIISGRSSIQGILKELGSAYTIPGGKVINKSVGFIIASEFSSSLVADPAAMTILTDLYDRHWNTGEYRSLLKMETFELKDPTITMLVATNEAHFEDFVAKKDIQGGFIGRMFVVAESEVQRLNPLVKPLKDPPDYKKLSEYMKEVSKVQGEFQYGLNAGELYEQWYLNFYSTIKEQQTKDLTGTIQRFGDSVLKVAMLLSLGESPELVITEANLDEAITICEKLVLNVRKTTMGKEGRAEDSIQKALIIKELISRENYSISRTLLLRKNWMNFNANTVDEIAESLEQAGIIEVKSVGNQVIYSMSEQNARVYTDYFNSRRKK